MKLKIEDKADRTAKGYEFICPIFRLDKTSLHQGLERLIAFNFKCYFILLMPMYDKIPTGKSALGTRLTRSGFPSLLFVQVVLARIVR